MYGSSSDKGRYSTHGGCEKCPWCTPRMDWVRATDKRKAIQAELAADDLAGKPDYDLVGEEHDEVSKAILWENAHDAEARKAILAELVAQEQAYDEIVDLMGATLV